jgi:hypothetical protein
MAGEGPYRWGLVGNTGGEGVPVEQNSIVEYSLYSIV